MTSPAPNDVLRVLVADDEPAARDKLVRLLGAYSDVVVAGTASNGPEAVRSIRELAPDVVLLDIRMPELDGLEVVDEVSRDGSIRTHIVFVTAYDEYAIRAFEVRALDYILKPFDAARLAETFDRVRGQVELERKSGGLQIKQTLSEIAPPTTEAELENSTGQRHLERICIKSVGKVQFIRMSDVEWIEAYGNYVRLHTPTEHPLARHTIRHLAERLDPRKFCRIHRSAIANLERIREMTPTVSGDYVIRMASGVRLRLSRSFRAEVVRRLGEL
jgi:two-component system LytT family response regulator